MDEKKERQNEAVYIRSDGWVFTEDGVRRLKQSGLKGKRLAEEQIEKQIGKRHRVRGPIDRSAFEVLRQVKGIVPRAVFVSNAVVAQSRKRTDAVAETAANDPIIYVYFTFTEDAHRVVEKMDRATFRRFVSTAIRNAAKRRKVA